MKKLPILVGCIFLAATLYAQTAAANLQADVVAEQFHLPVYTLNPAPIAFANVTVVGNGGTSTYYYWLVANYPLGSLAPSGPFSIQTAAGSLSASNYVQISFTNPLGVTSVDVLRTLSPTIPVGACACAVATTVTSGLATDQSASTNAYTVPAPVAATAYTLKLRNEVQSAGVTHLILRQGPSDTLVCDLSIGCNGGLSGTGTAGTFPVWTGMTSLGNSNLTDVGGYGALYSSIGGEAGQSWNLETAGSDPGIIFDTPNNIEFYNNYAAPSGNNAPGVTVHAPNASGSANGGAVQLKGGANGSITGAFISANGAGPSSGGNVVINPGNSGAYIQLGGPVAISGDINFLGSSSGSAIIQVAAAAGTPNPLTLPKSTGAAGSLLTTDGANPQQTAWETVSQPLESSGGVLYLNGSTGTPTLAVNAAAGSGASEDLNTGSSDCCGGFSVTTGTGGTTGTIATLTFSKTYTHIYCVGSYGHATETIPSGTAFSFVADGSTSMLLRVLVTPLTDTTAYFWNYHCDLVN